MRRVLAIVPVLLLLAACSGGTADPGSSASSSPSAGSSSASAEATIAALPQLTGYTYSDPAADVLAKLQQNSTSFGYADVAIRQVGGQNAHRILFLQFSGGTADPGGASAAPDMAFALGTKAGQEIFTEIIDGRAEVEHSAATMGVIGTVYLFSFAQDGVVYWVMADDDLEGGHFVQALVGQVVPSGSTLPTGTHSAASGEPALVPVPGYAYADLTASEAKQFGVPQTVEGYDAVSSHRVTGPHSRVFLTELVPNAAMAADKNAMAVAADLAGTVLTAPEVDTVRTEKIGTQTARHSHFTLASSGDRMFSISFLREGTVYWLICDDDTDCTGYAHALVSSLSS